jgi:hypothetical protein
MKNRIFLYCIFTPLIYCFGGHALFAQSGASHPDKLPWVDGAFPAKRSAFEYRVARGEGATLSDARNDAFNGLLADLGNITVDCLLIFDFK